MVDQNTDEPTGPTEPTSGYSLRNISVLDDVGGSTIIYNENGSIIYSKNQSPGQLVIDSPDESSPAVGTEYIIVTGNSNSVFFDIGGASVTVQISGTSFNSDNIQVTMGTNSKCTLLKIASDLWIVSGDNLQYAT